MSVNGLRTAASRSRCATSGAWWRTYIARVFWGDTLGAIIKAAVCPDLVLFIESGVLLHSIDCSFKRRRA